MSDIPGFKSNWVYFWEYNDNPKLRLVKRVRELAPDLLAVTFGWMLSRALVKSGIFDDVTGISVERVEDE
jgi:hypothetical protein